MIKTGSEKSGKVEYSKNGRAHYSIQFEQDRQIYSRWVIRQHEPELVEMASFPSLESAELWLEPKIG